MSIIFPGIALREELSFCMDIFVYNAPFWTDCVGRTDRLLTNHILPTKYIYEFRITLSIDNYQTKQQLRRVVSCFKQELNCAPNCQAMSRQEFYKWSLFRKFLTCKLLPLVIKGWMSLRRLAACIYDIKLVIS